MPDDVLRLRATVVSEEALANIRKIGREIGMIPQQAGRGVAQVNTQFVTLGATIKSVGRELTQAIPALGGFGLGAAGVGLAAGAMIRTLTDAAKRVNDLRYASVELRMGTAEIRGWTHAAERVGISSQTMMQNMQSFSQVADGLKYNIGGVRSRLYELGAGPVVRSIMAATDQGEKLRQVFKFKDTLLTEPNGVFKAGEWMRMWGFGMESLRLTAEEAVTAAKKLGPVTKEAEEAAKRYQEQLAGLNQKWDDLVVKAGNALLPGLTKDMENLQWIIDKLIEGKRLYDEWVPGAKGPSPSTKFLFPQNPLFNPGFDPNAPGPRVFTQPTPLPPPPDVVPPPPFAPTQPQPNMQRQGGRFPWEVEGTRGIEPISFRGLDGTPAANALQESKRVVKEGTLEALIEWGGIQTDGGGAGGGGAGGIGRGRVGRAGGLGGVPGGDTAPGGVGGTGGASGGIGRRQPGGRPVAPPGGGTSTAPGSGGGAPPEAILAKAREVAATEGAGGLKKFMADQGYPQHDNWCGDFAAAVVTASGGTPPKNPEVASNWRNWGTKVEGAPQPGDIAVAKPGWSRRGSGQTGQPGSHVTIVESGIDPRTGKFKGLGGNQGRRIAPFDPSKFDFYRSDGQQRPGQPPPGATLPNGQAPSGAVAPEGGLAGARARYGAELKNDPDLARLLSASTNAEVGGQGKGAQQDYIESVMNRAAARGMTLREALSDPSYYPKTTRSKLGAAANPKEHADIVAAVLAGSNTSGYATGNESGGVHSGGARVTKDYGPRRERFVQEKDRRDQEFIRRMQARGQAGAPPPGAQIPPPSAGVTPGGSRLSLRQQLELGGVEGDDEGHGVGGGGEGAWRRGGRNPKWARRETSGVGGGDEEDQGRGVDLDSPTGFEPGPEFYPAAEGIAGKINPEQFSEAQRRNFQMSPNVVDLRAGGPDAIRKYQEKTGKKLSLLNRFRQLWDFNLELANQAGYDDLQKRRAEEEGRIDSAISPPPVSGSVNVTVNSNGTKASTSVKNKGGLFQKSTVRQHRQMQRTEDAGSGAEGVGAEAD